MADVLGIDDYLVSFGSTLTLSLALDEVLAEVDRDRIEWRQVGVAVDGEEGVDLPLRSVLGGEVLDNDIDRLHLGRSNLKINFFLIDSENFIADNKISLIGMDIAIADTKFTAEIWVG